MDGVAGGGAVGGGVGGVGGGGAVGGEVGGLFFLMADSID